MLASKRNFVLQKRELKALDGIVANITESNEGQSRSRLVIAISIKCRVQIHHAKAYDGKEEEQSNKSPYEIPVGNHSETKLLQRVLINLLQIQSHASYFLSREKFHDVILVAGTFFVIHWNMLYNSFVLFLLLAK